MKHTGDPAVGRTPENSSRGRPLSPGVCVIQHVLRAHQTLSVLGLDIPWSRSLPSLGQSSCLRTCQFRCPNTGSSWPQSCLYPVMAESLSASHLLPDPGPQGSHRQKLPQGDCGVKGGKECSLGHRGGTFLVFPGLKGWAASWCPVRP